MIDMDVTEPVSAVTSTNGAAEQSPPISTARPNADVELASQILERVVAHTSVAPRLPRWPFLQACEHFRQLRGSTEELCSQLLGEFTEQQLLRARILQRRGQNTVVLSPVFGDSTSRFLVHYNTAGKPVDASSSRGLLSSGDPPWLRHALARRADDEQLKAMYLAFSDLAGQILASLGRRFEFAGRPERLTGKSVRKLAERAQRNEPPAYLFILPAWEINDLAPAAPPVMVRMLEHLAKCPRHFNYDPAHIMKIWMVDVADCTEMRDAHSFRDLATFLAAFKRCRTKPLVQLDKALDLIREQDSAGYAAARRRVSRAIAGSKQAPLVAETSAALENMRAEFSEKISEPIEALGHELAHPMERGRASFAADLSRAWLEQTDEVADARQIIAGQLPDRADAAARLDKRIKLAKTILQIGPFPPKF